MDSRIKMIFDKWYLTEPALLMTVLAHELVLNANMSCPFRCGRGKIEYNPELINKLSDSQLENSLKAEAIRTILKHPYERQPDGCKRKSMALGSNLVLSDNYDFSDINMPKPSDYDLPENESYEWYSMRIEGKGIESNSTDNTINSNSEGNETVDTPSDQDDNTEVESEGIIDDSENEHNTEGQSSSDSNSDTAFDASGLDDSEAESSNTSQSSNGGQPSNSGQDSSSNDDEYFILTLADGTTMRISKGNSKGKPEESQESISNEPESAEDNIQDSNSQNKSDQRGEHPEENRKFNNSQKKIQKKIATPSEDLSSLWEEDSLMSCTIDSIIEDIESSGASWGSLAGNLAETIIANTKAKIDYRKTLSGFRASILSSKRHLTRMRPNRRSGFENMGSIRRFDTNLLIAVDVSASISDEVLTHFYSVIGKIFKYGIEHVDVVQFDCNLSEVQSFEKAKKRIDIVGRGGTSFQPIFDFVHKNYKYDGLIIFTDGYAPKPKKPKGFKTKVVWVCENEDAYNKHKTWMKETGRCCTIKL